MSSSLHTHTPSLAAVDPRGLIVRHVDYHRSTALDPPQAHVQRQVYDNAGLMIEQWDPRLLQLQQSIPGTLANVRMTYSLSRQTLRTDSVDAGWQITLRAEAGPVLECWDARGAYQRYEHDRRLRPLAVFEQAADQPAQRCVERLGYAPGSSDEARLQRCGRLIRHDDPAGTLLYGAYGIKGDVLQQSRRFHPDWLSLNWPVSEAQRDTALETENFVTTWQYGAVGQLLEQIDARGNRQQLAYGLDGQPASSAVLLADGQRQRLVDDCTYDAWGRPLSERSGNGVIVKSEYGAGDGRLKKQWVYRQGEQEQPLQALSYDYDASGNVARVADTAQPIRWSHNTQVEAVNIFEYDTLSQLIRATGRESVQSSIGPALPAGERLEGVDDTRWRNYTQHYTYDKGGNLKTLQHVPSTGVGYTRRMNVAASSNHACPQPAGYPEPRSRFDAGGNQLELARGQTLSWNVRGQLARVAQVARADEDDDESYGYDANGQRVLKRRRARSRMRTHTEEIRYLPGLQIRRNTATGERLNVVTAWAGRSPARILQWEQGRPVGLADTQVRFSVSDHLGSCSLELGAQAQLISQEMFYPFGGTAWSASRNTVEAAYKTIRYCGKERDASGLYYYGYRYYAPWLQRWISPDPAGSGDGLNLYRMVGNNPLTFIDSNGLQGQRALIAGVAAAFVILAGILGAQLDHEISGAAIGFVLGVLLFAFAGGPAQPSPRRGSELVSDSEFGEILQAMARDIATYYRLSHDEGAALSAYAHEQRTSPSDVSFLISPGPAGSLFAHAGPTQRKSQAERIIYRHRNPAPELARIGYGTLALRDPMRAPVQGQVSTAAAPAFEVIAAGRVSGSRRVRGTLETQAPVATQPPQAVSAPGLDIDATHLRGVDPRSPEGRSIAATLGHLREGRFAAVHWHQHQDRLWSADLHGYPGQTGRGAYRLMFEHTGGRHFRVQGVRNPHRR